MVCYKCPLFATTEGDWWVYPLPSYNESLTSDQRSEVLPLKGRVASELGKEWCVMNIEILLQ